MFSPAPRITFKMKVPKFSPVAKINVEMPYNLEILKVILDFVKMK